MNIIDALSNVRPNFGYGTDSKDMQTKAEQQALANVSPDELILNSKASIGKSVVYQSLEQNLSPAFTGLSRQTSPSANESSLFDYEEVANTVMAFISASMQNAKENGASEAELAEMFEQAQAGVNLGIDQALEELGEYDLLDDALREGIEKSRSLIAESIEELIKQTLPQQSEIDTNKPSFGESSNSVEGTQNYSYANGLYASNENNADLSITTADGDVVKITFSDTQQYSRSERYSQSSNEGGYSERYQQLTTSYRETNFSYTVEGELDDDERAAIGDVINQVNSIQKDFFSGNVEAAYEKAMQLGIDNEQLSTYTLDLQQTQTSVVSQKYQEVAALGDEIVNKLDKDIKPILDFLEQLKELQDKANELLSNNDDAFGQLLSSVYEAEFGKNNAELNRFNEFIDKFDMVSKPEQANDSDISNKEQIAGED